MDMAFIAKDLGCNCSKTCRKIEVMNCVIQLNFHGSNTFGTMEISS